jgi:hypothetical protein
MIAALMVQGIKEGNDVLAHIALANVAKFGCPPADEPLLEALEDWARKQPREAWGERPALVGILIIRANLAKDAGEDRAANLYAAEAIALLDQLADQGSETAAAYLFELTEGLAKFGFGPDATLWARQFRKGVRH